MLLKRILVALYVINAVILVYCFQLNPSKCRIRVDIGLKMVASDGGDFMSDLLAQGDFATAMRYMNSHPNLSLSTEDMCALLNHVDVTGPLGINPEVFYKRARRQGHLSNFGCMDTNYPIVDANLRDFEQILHETPGALASVAGIELEALLWLRNNAKTGDSPSMALGKKLKAVLHVGGVVTLSLAAKAAGVDDSTAVGTGVATVAALGVVESGALGHSPLKDKIECMASRVQNMLFKKEYSHEVKRQAAIFLAAYLCGSPILHASMNPEAPNASRRIYYYDDAPKVDVRDRAEGLLTESTYASGTLDMDAIKRIAVIAMTPTAVDAIEGKKPTVSNFARMLLALLFQKVGDPQVCTVDPSELPVRLLPTLALYGFVQSVLVLRENAKALEAATERLAAGGGVGDMAMAIEAVLPAVHPAKMRQAAREQKQKETLAAQSAPSKALEVLMRARHVSTPLAATEEKEEEEEIELIPGTTRVYTKEELVLPPNPSIWEVRELAKEVMNNKYKQDIRRLGKISHQTRQEVQEISNTVMEALKVYQEVAGAEENSMFGPNPKGAQVKAKAVQQKPPTGKECIEAQAMRSRLATSQCLESLGLGRAMPGWLQTTEFGLDEFIFVQSFTKDVKTRMMLLALFVQGTVIPMWNERTGKTVADAIDGAWASATPIRICLSNETKGGNAPSAKDLVSKLAELDRLVQQKAGAAFMGSVPVPDGSSYWSDDKESAPVMPEAPKTAAALLETHKGMDETRAVTEIESGYKRIEEIDARLARLAATEEAANKAAQKSSKSLLLYFTYKLSTKQDEL